MKLKRKFFNRNTLVVAKELLGKYLIRKTEEGIIAGRIVETEAYCGVKDLACHASKGLTERTKVMFGPPGHAYVYMIYGVHHCLNFVTREKGEAEAVLIRGISIIQNAKIKNQNYNLKFQQNNGRKEKIISGPGRVCREFKIDRKLNGADLCRNNKIWVASRGGKIQSNQIKRDRRIGVDYAGKWKDKLWRFYLYF